MSAILDDPKKDQTKIDTSLRGQAFRRAENQQPPKTMTPWEWEEWYSLHGMPENFADHADAAKGVKGTQQAEEKKSTVPFWKFWARKPPTQTKPNCARAADEDSEF